MLSYVPNGRLVQIPAASPEARNEVDQVAAVAAERGQREMQRRVAIAALDSDVVGAAAFGRETGVAEIGQQLKQRRRLEPLAIARPHPPAAANLGGAIGSQRDLAAEAAVVVDPRARGERYALRRMKAQQRVAAAQRGAAAAAERSGGEAAPLAIRPQIEIEPGRKRDRRGQLGALAAALGGEVAVCSERRIVQFAAGV